MRERTGGPIVEPTHPVRNRALPSLATGALRLAQPLARRIGWSLVIVVGLMLTVTALVIGTIAKPVAVPTEAVPDEVASSPDDLGPALEPTNVISAPAPTTYAVEEGDTLLEIADRFDSWAEAIRIASNLSEPDALRIGQVLVIPPASTVLEVVDSAKTVREIAAAYGVKPGVLGTYNGLAAEFVDQPIARDVVVLPPGLSESRTRQAATVRSHEPATTGSPTAADTDPSELPPATVYTIGEGDTILTIAEKLGIDADALVAANRIPDSDWIRAGEALEVPLWSRPARPAELDPSKGGIVSAATLGYEATPVLAATPPAPFTYEIAPGDTLSDVADRFGLDMYTLVNNNRLDDADLIRPGDHVTILPVSGLLYTVEPGDTLAGIAYAFEVDLGPIIDFNYLEDADFISVGRELILPGASPLPPSPPSLAARPQTSTIYEVAPGDTVLSIARRFGVDPDDVVVANGLRSPDRIVAGDQLEIVPGALAVRPASSPATTAAPPRQQTVTRNLPVPAPPPAAASRPSTPGGGGAIVSVAMQYNGYRYVWGGTTPAGFDSSGFIYYVMGQAGKPVPRGYWGQINAGRRVSRDELQPGDLVFFQNTYMNGLSHGGIYIGNGQFIHASTPETGVNVANINTPYWTSRWFGATRVW